MAGADPTPAEGPSERARLLGPFLAEHWRLPVPAQGEAPEAFSPLEASLQPADCGACHPQQLADWRTSLHADAFSPGFAGQLIEGGTARPASVRACQKCHTPLEEQQPFGPDLEPNPVHDPALRAAGLACAGCHVRAHERLGPPRRPELPPLPAALPHGGFTARNEFGESRFCAPCHQFTDRAPIAGKQIQDTHREWEASPHAARGETCQSCHMPDRRHLWRGIHDEQTVREAVDLAWSEAPVLEEDRIRARLRLVSRGVGHAFPTYVTPRVFVEVFQVDVVGEPLEATRARAVIGREIDFSTNEEVFDTRILPGQSFTLAYDQLRAPEADALIGLVTIDPDFHYRGVFLSYLPTLETPEAQRFISEALARTQHSSYTLPPLLHPLP